MAAREEELEDDLEDYDEFDDDDEDEGGLSGFVVLLMGIVMLGAFASVVWIAYQQGLKGREDTPFVAADPEPIKIENPAAGEVSDTDREVYDSLAGTPSAPVETLAEGPEEPLDRDLLDPIGAIAESTSVPIEVEDDAVADRIAQLEAADAALQAPDAGTTDDNLLESVMGDVVEPEPTAPTASPEPEAPAPSGIGDIVEEVSKTAPVVEAAPPQTVNAMSGSHLVQVGAFRSQAEADQIFGRIKGKMGSYLDSKASHVEVADRGERGTYYRLRIGPFNSASAASSYCTGLKERGLDDCFVASK